MDSIKGASEQYLTVIEASEYTGLSCGRMQQWRTEGLYLAYHKVGGAIRYSKTDLDDYMKKCRIEVVEYRQIWRSKLVEDKIGISKSILRRLELKGDFPCRVRISPTAVGWYSDEVIEWINSLPREGCTVPEKAIEGQKK